MWECEFILNAEIEKKKPKQKRNVIFQQIKTVTQKYTKCSYYLFYVVVYSIVWYISFIFFIILNFKIRTLPIETTRVLNNFHHAASSKTMLSFYTHKYIRRYNDAGFCYYEPKKKCIV